MRTFTKLRRLLRANRVRLGKRVKNVPKQLSEKKTEDDKEFCLDIREKSSGVVQLTPREYILHPTKGWRIRTAA